MNGPRLKPGAGGSGASDDNNHDDDDDVDTDDDKTMMTIPLLTKEMLNLLATITAMAHDVHNYDVDDDYEHDDDDDYNLACFVSRAPPGLSRTGRDQAPETKHAQGQGQGSCRQTRPPPTTTLTTVMMTMMRTI